MTAPAMKPWPKLSETLTGPRAVGLCQSCGGKCTKLWLEHDDDDKPRPVVVSLCLRCAKSIMEPHPRLYRQLHEWEPMPGVMAFCATCVHQDGVRCANPQAQINGGPGLVITHPQPINAHICRRPRGRSGWTQLWTGAPRSCNGHAVMKVEA